MKSKGAASNLRVKVPNEQANPDASASGPPGQTAPKEQHDPPVPKLNDIPPLNWKKRTLTPTSSTPPTSSKRRPTGTPQGPRYDLMSKASAPDLRKQNAHADGTDKEKSPSRPGTRYNLRKKSSAPDLRRAAKDHAPGVGDCPPLPRPKTTQNIRDPDNSDDLDDGPRFMVPKAEDKKKSPEFKSHLLSGPKLPSIIGSAPSRMRPKKKPAAMPVKQTRSKRLMGILKHPAFKTRWKSTARNLTKMRVMKRAYGCVKFFRNGAKRRLALQVCPQHLLKYHD